MNLAFVGCGKIARAHATAALALGAKIVAASGQIGSKNLASFQQDFQVSAGYQDWRKMLKAQDIEGVVVCAPWHEVENLVEEIASIGKPCLIEKPLALSAKRAREIFDRTQKFHSQLMIGYNRRFYEFMPSLKDAIRCGGLMSVSMEIPEVVPESARNHALVYMTSHWLDLVRYLCGELKVEYVYPRKTNLQLNAILSANQVPVHLSCLPGAPAQIALTFYFKDKVYQLKPIERLAIFDSLEKKTDAKGLNSYEPRLKLSQSADSTFKPGFLGQMKSFLTLIRDHDRSKPFEGCNMADALATTELCERLQSGA